MNTKEEIVQDIAGRLGVATPAMSTGSTEPRVIFDLAVGVLGIDVEYGLTKPEMARAIVEASGASWNADFESSGGTVTRRGLLAVRDSVEFFLGARS